MISRILRDDLSSADVQDWIRFARNLYLVLVVSIVIVATLASVVATTQARRLLEASLAGQGQAIAGAVARAAFVPLSLEDDEALAALLGSYEGVDDLAYLRVADPRGRIRSERVYLEAVAGRPVLSVEVPVAPLLAVGGAPARARAAGTVRIDMSAERVRRESRRIALFNIAGSVLLSVVVLVAGAVLMRQLIARMRDVVGEARMARELKQVNAELEAFSYSVSHDLRAPLRSVDGFSHILLEDYAAALDEQGKDYLGRIRRGCQRMGQLIDDLLKLSRVVRQELRLEEADLAAIARAVAEQLVAGEPGRTVTWVIPDRMLVRGDTGLLRAALENLLGNAWKFTGKRPDARIEFGETQRDGARVFFVRDNGAGFEMAYANKLFGAFQRLHSQQEYAGTGIGLATVQRIVTRHGGRVWAESVVGQGATFSFTLR